MSQNRPSTELLEQYAPLNMWERAEKEAQRSPHYRHKTGCVIYCGVGHNELFSTGTAHPHSGGRRSFSIHAEMHAISRLPPKSHNGVAVIVTLNKSGKNFAANSRPCVHCANLLKNHVMTVIYPELCNDGSWAIRVVDAAILCSGYLKPTKTT